VPVQCFAAMTLSNTSPALNAEKGAVVNSAIPQFTAAPVSQEKVAISSQEMQKSSLETLDVDASGNWLEKRYWHQKAEKTYEFIKTTVAQIIDMRSQFYNAVHGIGQQLDTFYEMVNFDKGQVDRILQDALQETEFIKEDRGDLSASERDIKRTIQTDQKQLETLGKIIKSIHDLDKVVEQVFGQALQTIDNARKYETQAWEGFKNIAYELDDKKAEAEYYKIDGYYQNSQQALGYLQTQLLGFLQQNLIQKINSQMSQVQQILAELKKKDLDIVALINKQRTQDIDVKKAREQEAIKLGIQDAEEKFEEKMKASQRPVVKQLSWYQTAVSWLQIGWNTIIFGAQESWNFTKEKAVSAYAWLLSWVKK